MSDSSRSGLPNKLPRPKNILCDWFFLTTSLPSLPENRRQNGKAGISSHHFVILPVCVATSQRFWKQEQQFNSSEFIGVIRIVFLESLLLKMFIHIHLIILLYTYSDFCAWDWKAGSSMSSNCQRTNHQATVCYLSSRTFFHHKILFSSALQNFRMKFLWQMSEAKHIFAENSHQGGPCSSWEYHQRRSMLYMLHLCMYSTSLRPANFQETPWNFDRRKLQIVFGNTPLGEVRAEMKKTKAGSSGIQGRNS